MQRIDVVGSRLAAVTLEMPVAGSDYADDSASHPTFGTWPAQTAIQRLTVTFDHVEAFATLYRAEGIRRYAQTSLLRPAFEGPVVSRWLLDHASSPTQRIGRAIGLRLKDLSCRHKT